MKYFNAFFLSILFIAFLQPIQAQGFGFGPQNTTIPDNGCGSNEFEATTFVVEVGELDFSNQKNVGYIFLNCTHPYVGDLRVSLTSPEGTTVLLANQVGGSGNDFINTSFASWATTPLASGSPPFSGYFIPSQSLTAFDGEWADGLWTLTICDAAGGDVGTFNNASIWFSFENDRTKVISTDFFTGNGVNYGHGGESWNIASGDLTADYHGRADRAMTTFFNGPYNLSGDNGWLNPTQGISMAAWIKPVQVNINQQVLSKGNSMSNFYSLGLDNGEMYAEVAVDGNYYTVDGGSLTDGEWAHIAMTYEPGGLFKIYVNGNQVNGIAAGSAPLINITGTGTWTLGASALNTNNALFAGDLDHLGVWNYAISQTQVRADMAALNNDCRRPLFIPVQGNSCTNPRQSHNFFATSSGTSPNPVCANYSGGDLWFNLIVPGSGNITVETDLFAGQSSFTDAGMEIYSGTCGNLTRLDCDDDSGPGNHSEITLTNRPPGEELFIRVWEYSNNSDGFFSICAFDPVLVSVEGALESNECNVFPNPTDGPVRITWSNGVETAAVGVFDLTGRNVMATEMTGGVGQMNLAGLASGTYVVQLRAGDLLVNRKVIRK